MPSEIGWNQPEIICLVPLGDLTFSDLLPSEIPLKTYNDPLQCISYMTTTKCRNIYLIILDTIDETILKLLHKLRQVVSLYLLQTGIKEIELTKYYAKLSRIFHDKRDLCNKLLNDINILSACTTTLASKYPPELLKYSTTSTTILFIRSKNFEQLSLNKLNNEQAKFIWFQFLTRAIRRLREQTNNKYEKMLATCRIQFESDTQQLDAINDFK
ncbi:unnamed protein product, partial [Didymodactylos carnosus]